MVYAVVLCFVVLSSSHVKIFGYILIVINVVTCSPQHSHTHRTTMIMWKGCTRSSSKIVVMSCQWMSSEGRAL